MFENIKQLLEMQKKIKEMKKELSDIKVEHVKSGFSLVVNGEQKVESINFPEDFSGIKKEDLEKLLKDLINETAIKLQKTIASRMKDATGLNLGDLM